MPPTQANLSALLIKCFHGRAGAEEVSVAINVVDARDRWPEFVFERPGRRESCSFARVRPVPFVGCDLSRGVRRVFQHIISPMHLFLRDRLNLCMNEDHCVAETVEFMFWFAFGRLDHHCTSDGKRNCRRVEPSAPIIRMYIHVIVKMLALP